MPAPYKSSGEPSRTVIGDVTPIVSPKPPAKKYPKLIVYGVPMLGIGLLYYWYKK